MAKFKNKYRIASARAQWWDYGWNGAYFITICTKNREHFFGEINNGKMVLSPTGVIADILWHEIPNHAPFVELGDFVVMPNHIHGILILDKPVGGNHNVENDTVVDTDTIDRACPVSIPIGSIDRINVKSTNHRTKSFSKYWKKYDFINYWIIQIGRNQTCQPIGVGERLANPFSRPHHS